MIRVKRGVKENIPILTEGEPGYVTDDREFWVGGAGRNRRVDFPAVYPEEYGAKGDGVTDDTVAIQAACTAAGANGCVLFSNKTYLVLTAIVLPATDITIRGSGTPVLDTSGTNSILKQTNHGALVTIEGIRFTGGGYGIEFDCDDETEEFYEYSMSNCTFDMDTGVYGIYMVGAREGTIDHCYFIEGNGIYRSHSNVCIISDCIFKSTQTQVGTAIYDNGVGVAYSCGLSVVDCVIMGYEYGVIVSRADDFNISGSTIDYNTYNIRILGQDTGSLGYNYLGSSGTNPALLIDSVDGDSSRNIIISNNKIVGHTATAGYDCIYVGPADNVSILGNEISFFTRYGVNYSGTTYLRVFQNRFAPRGGSGTNSVFSTSDNSVNQIAWNTFITVGESIQYARCWENIGGTEPSVIANLQSDDAQLANLLKTGTPEFVGLSSWGDTKIGTIDGSEIVVNGGFDTNTASWNANYATIASIAGGQTGNCLELTRTSGTYQYTEQQLSGLTVGSKYRFSCYSKSGTSGNETYILTARRYSDAGDEHNITGTTSGSWVQASGTFTCTETTYDILLFKFSATAGTMLFDTVSLVELIPLVNAADDAVAVGGDLKVATGKVVKVAGMQVLGARRASTPTPSGGTVIDAEARAAIASILLVLEGHGLTGTVRSGAGTIAATSTFAGAGTKT